MTTRCATGSAQNPDTRQATRAAYDAARAALMAEPQACIVFAGPSRSLTEIEEVLRSKAPGLKIVGCHTAGEFTERGLTHEGVSLMLLLTDEYLLGAARATGARGAANAVAKSLASGWAKLASEAGQRKYFQSASVVLVDGLAGSGDAVISEYQAATRVFHQIVGGAAGDEGKFRSTGVLGPGGETSDGAAVLQVFGAQPWGVGLGHGLRPASKRMRVTRAVHSRLYEIDGRPAIEAYRKYAATKGTTLTEANQGSYLIGNEIGVMLGDELLHARAPVGVEPDGSLKLVADIDEGASIFILDGDPAAMVAACGTAAQEAKRALQGQRPAGVLVFDCVCRGMILGPRGFADEIEAVRAVFPDVPLLGFLTYGEIARFGARLDGWHNTTTVVAAIPGAY